MTAYLYTLTIEVPAEIDADTEQEIRESREPHDTDGGTGRWLGGQLADAETRINDVLPDGWKATLDEVGSFPNTGGE